MKKRVISIMITTTLLINAFFSFGFTSDSNGYNAAPVIKQNIGSDGSTVSFVSLPAAAVSDNTYALKGESVFPDYYSSKDLGYTSGVDNQGSSDVCWAFTHNELLEINLAKKYGVKYDFSEQAMKFETSNITNSLYGYMRNPNSSGNELFSTAYLARAGSVMEQDEPFSINEQRSVDPDDLKRYGRLVSVPMFEFGVNSKNTYNSNAVNTIKSLVTEYGAVGTALFYDQSMAYQPVNKTNYYYDGIENSPNHAVTIIGWDDNYSASNFTHIPDGDGAFIVKNSWGLYHDNNTSDYVYVSYYDKHITNQIYATDYETENSLYDNIYQYDYMGWTQSLASTTNDSIFCVTRFVADRPDETVSAVATYITQPGITVKVHINTTGDFTDKNSYTTIHQQYFDTVGYYVMPVTPTKLSGNEYYIAIEMSSDSGQVQFAIQSDLRRIIDNSVCIPNTCYIGTSLSELATLESVCYILNSQTVIEDSKIYNPMLCVKVFTKSSGSSEYENIGNFTDVQSTRWYAQAVDYAVGANLFSGVTDTTFEPATEMTRAMFVQVLANLTNVDLSNYTSRNFQDVEPDRWFAKAVDWAVSCGIVNGMTPTTFEPHLSVSRQQMCVMILRYAQYLGFNFEQADNSFVFADDSNIQSYAREAIYTCYKYGIIDGMTETTFEPRSGSTRAQVANLFKNFCQKYIY